MGLPPTFEKLTQEAYREIGNWEIAVRRVLEEHPNWSDSTKALYVRGYVVGLMRAGYVSRSFYDELRAQYKQPSRTYALRTLREDMLAAVFMAAAGERDAIMWMAIMGVLAALGVRRESIIRLKTSDVVLQGNVLNMRMFIPKKRGDYYVDYAIPTDLALGGVHIGQILEAYHKFRMTEPEGYYFYTSDPHQPISPSYLSNKIRAIGQKAGVRLQPTDFRRYALNRIATRHGLAVAAAMAAHSNVKTTQRYLSMDEILNLIGRENAVR